MNVGSLFSGIGGLDLGLERAGMRVVWQCESDSYCRAVLRKHWPDVPCYDDVRAVADDAPAVDLICGGFPCQPVSFAGKGLAQADERWLWPEFARIVRALRPNYVLVENVPGLLARGVGDVLGDLAESGYDAEWDCIPAAAVGAPHLRYRVFIVGYADGVRRLGWGSSPAEGAGVGAGPRVDTRPTGDAGSNANGRRLEVGAEPDSRPTESRIFSPQRGHADGLRDDVADAICEPVRVPPGGLGSEAQTGEGQGPERERVWSDVEYGGPASGEPSGSDAGWWAVEPDVGRVADGVPSRVDRLRCLGNAVVPQVAEWIGHQIMRAAS